MSERPEWTDERWTDVSDVHNAYEAAAKIAQRDLELDNGLTRYRHLMQKVQPMLYEKKDLFDRTVAARAVEIFMAGVYPDAGAPEGIVARAPRDEDGNVVTRKVSRTDAGSLAEDEVIATWPEPRRPSLLLEECKSQIHMLQKHLEARSAQLNGSQTYSKLFGAVEAGSRLS